MSFRVVTLLAALSSALVPVSPVSPTRAGKTSSREGCFSTYSTVCGEELFEFGEGYVLDDRAPVQDRDAIGELFGLVKVLRGEQYRRSLAGEFLHGLPHLDARLGVEPGHRFVEEDDRG